MALQTWLTHCSDRAASVIIVGSELTTGPPAFQSLILSPAANSSASLEPVPSDLEAVCKALLGPLASSAADCKSLGSPCGSVRGGDGGNAESTFSVLTVAADEIHAAATMGKPQLLLASSTADIQWAHACACAYAIRWLGVPATEAIHLCSAVFEPTLRAHLTACALSAPSSNSARESHVQIRRTRAEHIPPPSTQRCIVPHSSTCLARSLLRRRPASLLHLAL